MSSLWIKAGLVAGGVTLTAGAATAAFAATSGPSGPAGTPRGTATARTTVMPKSGCIIRVRDDKTGNVATAKKKAAMEGHKIVIKPGKPGMPEKPGKPGKLKKPGVPRKSGKPGDLGNGKKGGCAGTPVLLKGTVAAVHVAPGGGQETVRLNTGKATSDMLVLRKTVLVKDGRPVSPGTLPALTTGQHVVMKGLAPGGGAKTPLALVIVE